MKKQDWTERDIELIIGKILRYGVFISCAITLLGGLIYLLQQQGQIPDYSQVASGKEFTGTAPYLRGLSSIIPRILELDGAAIIQLGVIILIATPILRVAFSAIAFLVEKDYLYIAITLLVLAIIMGNMALGLH
ncbi:DUF1634 domain-containing protein [Viscerimonas tarda]